MQFIKGSFPGYLEEGVVKGHCDAFLNVAGVQGVKVESTGNEHRVKISVARLPVGNSHAFRQVVTRTGLNVTHPRSLQSS